MIQMYMIISSFMPTYGVNSNFSIFTVISSPKCNDVMMSFVQNVDTVTVVYLIKD